MGYRVWRGGWIWWHVLVHASRDVENEHMVPDWRHVVNGYHDVAAHDRFEEGRSSRRARKGGGSPQPHHGAQTNLPIDKLEGEKVRDLVKLMLRVDRTARTSRNARPTVTKCLHHEWFQEEAEENLAEDVIATLQSLPTTMTEAQSIVMEYLAERINLAQAHSVTQAFQAMDKDRSGFIDETEMRQILRDHGIGKEDEIVNGLLQHGVVTYSKFMEKMLAQEKLSDVNALHDVFTGLDKDGNEALDWTEVTELFQYIDPSSPTGHEIFDSMDTDEDGRVSWPEFRQALSLRSSTSELS